MIGSNYRDFFSSARNERFNILVGGRRSGKTFATFQYLRALCGLQWKQKVLVVCASYPELSKTIEDFTMCTGISVVGSAINGFFCHTEGHTFWQFASFDKYTKAQGSNCDYLFINEAANVPNDIADVLFLGVRKQIFLNLNPTKRCWVNKRMREGNTLYSTYKDNPHLGPSQIEEFEEMARRGTEPNASMLDRYNYTVYCLGQFAESVGKVFGKINRIPLEEYEAIHTQEVNGMDFGFVEGKDQTAIVGAKLYENRLYLNQRMFDNSTSTDWQIAMKMVECGITPYDLILADYGGLGSSRITALSTAGNGEWKEPELVRGFRIGNAPKGSIIEGLTTMIHYDGIYVTEPSVYLIAEMEDYELDSNLKPIGEDHLIDCSRYASNYLKMIS